MTMANWLELARREIPGQGREINVRPHPTPKIRDEGLRRASKMMDDTNKFIGCQQFVLDASRRHWTTYKAVYKKILGLK
jgi:hypothetical protein